MQTLVETCQEIRKRRFAHAEGGKSQQNSSSYAAMSGITVSARLIALKEDTKIP